jgi:hypothetical protein
MKFIRRPDIDNVARIKIAAQAFLGQGVYGEITRVAKSYRVSRLFVYKLLWQLMLLYELGACDPVPSEAIRKEVDRQILLLREKQKATINEAERSSLDGSAQNVMLIRQAS